LNENSILLSENSDLLQKPVKAKRGWLWALSAVAIMSLTGCGMYPSKPGQWPHGPWGQLLQIVSSVIDFFAKHVGNSYGLSLLIVTILVRLLILPLMIKQIRTSKMMQSLQPEMKKVRSKYKGDNKKIQEETMKLYQSAGVNPMAGCLPTIIQLPILYALYGAIDGNVLLHKSVFLGLFNLGHQDHTFILPILAAISTFLSTKVMMTGQDQQQKMMLYIMPLMILLIGYRLPCGLALYWVYSNLFTAIQTYFIRVRPQARQA
jgi:YidC/Oxa1 family membrane protein insertase